MPVRNKAGIRIRRWRSPWAGVLPYVRWLATLGLIIAAGYGGVKFIDVSQQAGALDFTTHTMAEITTAVGVRGMAAADLDDDGDVDVVTVGSDDTKVYSNNGDKTFTMKVIDNLNGERVQVIDLNNDGSQDLLVTLRGRSPSVRWYRNGGGLNFDGIDIGTNNDGRAFAGDIDGDGDADVVTATKSGDTISLQRWMNDGTGSFSATTLSSDSGVTAITIGDMDGDGYPDIVTGGSSGLERWDTDNGFTWDRIDLDSNTGQEHLVVVDLNKDNNPDIIAAEPAGDLLIYNRNKGDLTFDRIEVGTSVDVVTVVPVDLDEDGDEDIVAAAQDDNDVYWFSNNGSDEFTKITLATKLQSVFGIAVADLDDDNDFDVVAGDLGLGAVYWYERVAAKPVATAPGSFSQSTDGLGVVTFTTTLSDNDRDETRLRVQYSRDGTTWYKPWITKVTANKGSVDLKNSNGYQIGTANGIDTDGDDEVKLTITWDSQTTKNTGGPIVGDVSDLKMRVMPRDGVGNGDVQTSSGFRIDNLGPTLAAIREVAAATDQIELGWDQATDKSAFDFNIYYGADHVAVLEKTAAVWNVSDDALLADIEAKGTTVTGLTENTLYSFKLWLEDAFGNETGVPSIRVSTASSATPAATPDPLASPTPIPTVDPAATPGPIGSVVPTLEPLPTLEPGGPVIGGEGPPVADAGVDQVVNPGALVILNGTESLDPKGGVLSFSWRQIDGPEVQLDTTETATPSFTVTGEDETYLFVLTVRDEAGTTASDTAVVATRSLLVVGEDGFDEGEGVTVSERSLPTVVSVVLGPINTFLLSVTLLLAAISLYDRINHAVSAKSIAKLTAMVRGKGDLKHRGRVVHYKTGVPIAGAKVQVVGAKHKIVNELKTNARGVFAAALPSGDYTLTIEAEGFTFSPVAVDFPIQEDDVLYTGGELKITEQQPVRLVIPLKPTGEAISSGRLKLLQLWQGLQHRAHKFAWPVLIAGATLNTGLLLWVPTAWFLGVEVVYIAVVIFKILVEIRVRPAYGMVRDAITHVPLDLAVVRLYEQGTNRLVMTRATDGQGKFFALPPTGTYTVTVAKEGYATFSRDEVAISGEHDTTVQLKADLMPVAPPGVPRPVMA